ncbi:hypothetical protein AV545_14820 [Paenibacillus jamilae]|uniref:DUF4272 domain-containing protein n=1 Tax=Paenibacillus jamilae TaxID=114136 RepID=UPI0007AB3B86|nr:DUF4272 domain-containing protein [Paenibacillus jamilae]KZE72521.1 hypothetical protein AV545_14820 [Paenibacillus jamilae]
MRNCALYSSTFDLDQVEKLLNSIYPNNQIHVNESKTRFEVKGKGWFNKKVKGFNIMTSKTNPEEFASMLNGMINFFSQIPAENKQLQQKLLIKISTLNMVIGVETEEDISKAFFAELLDFINSLDGLMFWGGGNLLAPDGSLLLDVNGRSEVEDYTVTAHVSYLHGEDRVSESGMKRKLQSEKKLVDQGFTQMPPIPGRLGDEAADSIRSLKEVAGRAVALCIVALKGECIGAGESMEDTKRIINQVTDQYGADCFFSPEEKRFLFNDYVDESEGIQFSWRYEGFWVLLWALGHLDQLGDPTGICDVPLSVSKLQQFYSFEDFLSNSRLRSSKEILDEADLIWRYDWLCVDSRIHKQPAPGNLDDGVVYERHRVLKWLTSYMGQEWDDVRTDT